MYKKYQHPWNLGLTKETDSRVKKQGEKSSISKKGCIPWNKDKKGLQSGWNKGIPQSESAKEKNRIAHLGVVVSEETKEKHRKPMLEETKNKISIANTGKVRSEKTREKIGQSKIGNTYTTGQKRTKEQKENMRQSKLHLFSALDHLLTNPYCPLFTPKLREEVRLRDSYICQNCGYTQEEHKLKTGKRLPIHHIHYDKPNCYPDLICLCISCNSKVNKKSMRNYYEELFMNKLNNRELLFWTKRR